MVDILRQHVFIFIILFFQVENIRGFKLIRVVSKIERRLLVGVKLLLVVLIVIPRDLIQEILSFLMTNRRRLQRLLPGLLDDFLGLLMSKVGFVVKAFGVVVDQSLFVMNRRLQIERARLVWTVVGLPVAEEHHNVGG